MRNLLALSYRFYRIIFRFQVCASAADTGFLLLLLKHKPKSGKMNLQNLYESVSRLLASNLLTDTWTGLLSINKSFINKKIERPKSGRASPEEGHSSLVQVSVSRLLVSNLLAFSYRFYRIIFRLQVCASADTGFLLLLLQHKPKSRK